MSLKIVSTIAEMREVRRTAQSRFGLVPTMGALHKGHCSLIRAAKQRCAVVAVSLFVNPTQFGPREDFAKYPRTFEEDCALLEREGVDVLFAPLADEIHPPDAETFVDAGRIGKRLDGASRPGHFRGVATVVLKLFHITQPDLAFFGQKDAAQVAVLRAMVRDLHVPVELVVCPTVREEDGLARSSRNRFLSPAERGDALVLSCAMNLIRTRAEEGAHSVAALEETLRHTLAASPNVKVEYAAIVDPQTLLPIEQVHDGALIVVAAWIGETRLIDNLPLCSTLGKGDL